MPITPLAAHASLTNNPGAFLKRYPVRIFGATAASGQANYHVVNQNVASVRPGSILGTHRTHVAELLEIRSVAAFVAVPAGTANHMFAAHSVHMDGGFAARTIYLLAGGGPAIMVTGQLSGCAFVMTQGPNAGEVNVSHIQPVGTTGALLHAHCVANVANAQVYGASGTHGNYDSADRLASVIGIRAGGQWRIYAQKQDGNGYGIKSVYRIWPDRHKL